MLRWECNQGVRQELDLTTYRSNPLDQSEASSSQISSRPEHSDIIGHKLLIFHSSEYRLAFNRIYTLLSMSQGVLPSPSSDAKMFFFHEGTLKICPAGAPLVPLYLGETTWKLTTEEKMKFVLAALWTKTKSSRGKSQAVSLCSPELLNPLTTVELFMIMSPNSLLGTILLCWSKFCLQVQKYVISTMNDMVRQTYRTETWANEI